MRILAWGLITVALLVSAPGVATAVTPANGLVVGTVTAVNNGPGDQTDPHVSGDLSCYTDGSAPQRVRYYRFSTVVDAAVPSPPGTSDILCDVSGNRITFTRTDGAQDAIFVFDTGT